MSSLLTDKKPSSFFLNRGTRFKALFALGLVCIFWGTTWIATKQGVLHTPALQVAGLRQFISGLLYIFYFVLKGARWPRGKEWWPVIILALLNFTLTNGLTTWGIQYISAGLGAIISATFPLWIVVINLFSAKTKEPPLAIIGLLLGFAGVCIIFYDHLADLLQPDFRLGILLSLLGAWTWAFGVIYTKKQAASFNPYFSIGLQMLLSGSLTSIIANASGIAIPYQDIPWQTWSAIAYLTCIGSVVTFAAYLYALQRLPTEQMSIYAYINPMVAVLLGALFFEEKLTIFIAIGGLVTLAGVNLINMAFRRK
ncbi:MAG: EamA family transporter [Candidatus Pseudobacter hemicellulosilyticus]|uniref:EamA family transporter n=1 Tax=Candidatus Pseudobacter hemicellulosilyticus TaxID=3121375 RepID=A0AAJ5WS91_9BACT|nr:MAG: EamA family transporter [Pseudobacter sp.]